MDSAEDQAIKIRVYLKVQLKNSYLAFELSSSICYALSYLLHGHARVEEDGEVSELVVELLAQDGEADGEAGDDGLGEGRADREAVDEVVHAVAEDDHPLVRGWVYSFSRFCRIRN